MTQVQDAYKNDFENFLSHTDEKEILRAEISNEIKKYAPASILDIGAGNGLLCIPLSRLVKRYAAIELNAKFCEKLENAGIQVIGSHFPCPIHETFDFVLASHVISYSENKYIGFINKAMDAMRPGGVFVLVTFRAQEDDWTRLMRDLGMNPEDKYRTVFNEMIELLNTFGAVTIRKVVTHVFADSLEDFVQSLCFVATDGDPKRKEAFLREYRNMLEKILDSKYRQDGKYVFPFQHFLITTIKKDV